MRKIYGLLMALAFGGGINAQQSDNQKPSSAALSEVTIQESRILLPFSKQNRDITLLDQAVIKTLPVKSVNELLAHVAGIDVRQRGPWGVQSDIGIDGGTFDQTLVLLNGVKLSDPQTGHNMMNIPVSLNAIERIEILKGPAARIYGVNALNGVINIITKQPEETNAELHLFGGTSLQRDSVDNSMYHGYGIEATASVKRKKWGHFFSAAHNASNGYRYNTAFNTNKFFYSNTLDLDEGKSLGFMGGFVSNDFGANGFYAAPNDKESKEAIQTAVAAAHGTLVMNEHWTLRPRLSYRRNDDDYIFVRQDPSIYQNLHLTNVFDAELNNTFFSGIGDFGFGLELRNEAINSNSLGKWSRSNYGLSAEYSMNKFDRLLVNVGAYANYNSDFGWQVLPGVDLGYELTNTIRLFAGLGSGQRLPTYTDLYYKGPSNIGNDQLQPEHSLNAELGVKFNNKRIFASATYFHKNVSDFVDWVKDSLTAPWQPENFQKIITDGISLSSDFRLTDPEGTGFLAALLGLSYTWLDPKIASMETKARISQYALENLRHQLAARANFTIRNHYSMTLSARHQERVNYKAYTLFDLRMSASHKQFELYADLSNLSNVTYIEAGVVPMVGRWVTLGMKWNWQK